MTSIRHPSVLQLPLTTSDDYVLDPRKPMSDYRREIYDLLQYLDEEQDKIEKQLTHSSAAVAASTRTSFSSQHQRDRDEISSDSEGDAEDDFVVVEDVNAANRKKQLLSQLQQLWKTRAIIRKQAKQLNIRIDSLAHGKGSGLMPFDDFLDRNADFSAYDDHDEL